MKPMIDDETQIEFRDVTYRDAGGALKLEKVSLEASRASGMCIHWGTVAERQAIVQLLTRRVQPSEGSILIGGKDVRDVPFAELSRRIAILNDSPPMFDGTVWENLLVARPTAGASSVFAAARAAGLDEWVMSLSRGYETIVEGELSADLRLRFSLARAILREAEVLVFVEPCDSQAMKVLRDRAAELDREIAILVLAAGESAPAVPQMGNVTVRMEGPGCRTVAIVA